MYSNFKNFFSCNIFFSNFMHNFLLSSSFLNKIAYENICISMTMPANVFILLLKEVGVFRDKENQIFSTFILKLDYNDIGIGWHLGDCTSIAFVMVRFFGDYFL